MCGRFCTLNFTIRIVENVSGKGNERSSRPQLIVMKQRAPPAYVMRACVDLFRLKLASSEATADRNEAARAATRM